MKHFKSVLAITCLLLGVLTTKAQTDNSYLGGEAKDSLATDSVTIPNENETRFPLTAISKGTDNKIILRWSFEESTPWMLTNRYGYRIIKTWEDENEEFHRVVIDSIKPWSLNKIRETYPITDSLAMSAAAVVYQPGNRMGTSVAGKGISMMDVQEEQENRFAYGIILSEMRKDLAEVMGIGYEDRDVKKGIAYDYIIKALTPDSIMLSYGIAITDSVRAESPKLMDQSLACRQASQNTYNWFGIEMCLFRRFLSREAPMVERVGA